MCKIFTLCVSCDVYCGKLLLAFNQYCCPKLPKGNGRADIEMRYGSYVYYLNTTYYDGRLIRISFAEKVRSDIQGIPDYCNASLPESGM